MEGSFSAHAIVDEEIQGFVRLFKDGHVERNPGALSFVPPSNTPHDAVASKDVVINHETGVWARLYLPQFLQKEKERQPMVLPLIVYFHGGGFVIGSASWSAYHVFLSRLASETKSVVVSVSYRLAPEYRLPAAYDDCFGAVLWLRRQLQTGEEPWLKSYADFSRCFVAGDSAGANIAHHVAVRIGKTEVKPLRIHGLILIQPFFGGEYRSKWERETCDPFLSQRWIEAFWKLSLPKGANRDHPACNPLGKQSPRLRDVALPPTFVCISELDVLRQRNLEYCEAMRKAGKNIRYEIFNGVGHAFEVLDPQSPQIPDLLNKIGAFMKSY